MTKLITIYGATGNQGGAVARSLLADKTSAFSIRGITRKPSSDPAKALAAAGAEVVRADGRQKEQLVAAFAGSWAVYANTTSDDPVCNTPRSIKGGYGLTRCLGAWGGRWAHRDGHWQGRCRRRGRGGGEGVCL
ncbi:NmrA family NAD(P)-binding protein [Candidatus Bathyarchaeota archaeon]|nr:NmrA family NAD(P)-binding protein [Candidatus Bathyarchaeota archaeon]